MRFDDLEGVTDEVWRLARNVHGPVSAPHSERCVTCGERIEALTFDEFVRLYTDHQVEVHGKPRTARER